MSLQNKIIFVIGVGRSGTSLLQSMLNAHRQITSFPETQFFRKYVADKRRRNKYQKAGLEPFLTTLTKDKQFARINISILDLKREITHQNFEIRQIYICLLKNILKKKGKEFVVDKDPRNIDYLKEIYNSFPDAYIIHIIRDPREVVLSKCKAAWSSKRPLWLHAMLGEAQLKNGRKRGKEFFKEKFIELKYEHLVSEPQKELTHICEALKLKFDPGMLNYEISAKELVSDNEMQWKKETLKPIITNNIDKWKSELSNYSIALIESVSTEAFCKLDYSVKAPKIKIFHQFLIYLIRLVSILFTKTYSIFKN